MKKRLFWWLAACLVLTLSVSTTVWARSDNSDRVGFTEADAEYYMPDEVYGFFRPGVDFHLISVEIPDDLQPMVTFRLTDPKGAPLDASGVLTPGTISMYFMLDYVPQGEENVVPYCSGSAFCYDRGGTMEMQELGTYTYKFATVLPDDYDADAVHTLSSVARRRFNDPEFEFAGLESDYNDNDVYNFIPSGAEGSLETRDVVRTATCNRCHDPLAMHGGGRMREVRVCVHCHNPENLDDYALGPMVHRIHSSNEEEVGEITYPAILNDCEVCHTGGIPNGEMPLVANPNPAQTCDGVPRGVTTLSWADMGAVEVRLNAADGQLFANSPGAGSKETGRWVKDGQSFLLVDKATGETLGKTDAQLTVLGCNGVQPGTFRGEAGLEHTFWMTNPSRLACGGCHVNVNFDTGENHIGGPQADDELCGFCHQPDSGNEFDRSVRGAHTVEYKSDQLPGVLVTIKSITNTGPGQHPTVVFSLNSKNGPINPASMNRMLFTLVGPNEDFESYAQENVLGGLTPVGNDWSYTFAAAVPQNATGSFSVGVEGRRPVPFTDHEGTSNFNDQIDNFIVPVAVTDAEPMARRDVVDDAKCENCHANLELHGENRHNASGYCQTCHRPDATDEEVRLTGTNESIHFKYMVHKIHRGEDLQNGYVVYGYRSSIHDYGDVTFPGDLRDCEACHVNDSYKLPLPAGVLPTESPSTFITEMEPITASCLSCHDSLGAASHAEANTSEFGESCVACHGSGKEFDVAKVHAR
ncbi:MAG: OmcA/MtrC family decaheme c-type cytochrome [Lysobacterales bacterium]|jgi:hypothetical protein